MPRRSSPRDPVTVRVMLQSLLEEKGERAGHVITLDEVEKASGVARSTLHKMSHGSLKDLSMDAAARLARYFGCEPGDLLGRIDEPPRLRIPVQLLQEPLPSAKVQVVLWKHMAAIQARDEERISPNVVAKKTRIPTRTIYGFINGTAARLPLDTATTLIDFFGIEPHEILAWSPSE
jgi:plasmid maintenance system antidote protein VapI